MYKMLPFFPQKVSNVTVTIGQDAVLRCKVDNLNNYKVAWVRVDTQTILTIHQNVITRNPRVSLKRPSSNQWFLNVQRAQETDRGWYMCQINTDPMVHKSGYLEVVVPPRILNKDQDTDLVVREGDNLTLSCEALGHPRPQIIWRRDDGDPIMVDGRKAPVVENPLLRLPKISRLHMGDYLCVASNGIAPSTSKKFRIRVQFPPMFWIPSQLEGAYLGQEVILECHSEAYPKSINYWVKEDGQMLISNEKYETLMVENGYKAYMKLRIRNISRDDFAEYKCEARNSLGASDGSISLYEVLPPTTTTTTTTTTSTTTAMWTTRTNRRKIKKGKKHGRKRYRDWEEEANARQKKGGNSANHISTEEEEEEGEGGNFFEKLGFGSENSPSGGGGGGGGGGTAAPTFLLFPLFFSLSLLFLH